MGKNNEVGRRCICDRTMGCSQAKNGRGGICFAQTAEINKPEKPNPSGQKLEKGSGDAIDLRDSLVTVFSQCNISPCTKMSTCHFGDSVCQILSFRLVE